MSSVAITFPRDAGIGLLSKDTTLEIPDARHPFAGNVPVQSPEFRLGIVHHFAASGVAVNEFLDAIYLVIVKAEW
jgi:hypothetical protein